jgi:hypothetical protein
MGLAWQCRGSETSDAGAHQFAKDMPHNIHQLRKGEHILRSRVFFPRRLGKIEDWLKEPMEIADPILNPGHSREYSRDICIYGALIKSIEACIGLADQKNVLNDIVSDIRHVKSALEIIKKTQANQNKASEDMMIAIKENAENIESKHKLVFAMFILVFIAVVANYFILMFIFR